MTSPEHAPSPHFDPTQALPPGITVLEASAGTGKTHTVASIAVSEVARGLPLHELLLVTFTRLATGELRDRVWKRLNEAEQQLWIHLRAGVEPTDEVVRALADADGDVVLERHRRLRDAVANFDAATIATIHSFCQQILSGIGLAGDVDRQPTFLEDTTPVIAEVVDDLLLAKRMARPDVSFTRDQAMEIARLIVTNPDAGILPDRATVDRASSAGLRVGFAHRFREDFDQRKRATRVLTYDDLLGRLAETLEHGLVGAEVQERLQTRFRLIAVDEFQDTDKTQWNVLTKAFTEFFVGTDSVPTRLVLIGDPKQAIYAFRGADVHTYLQADASAAAAGLKRTLGVNWRSDAALLRGLDAVFADAPLGDPIQYRSTIAADHHVEPRLIGGTHDNTAVRVRVVPRGSGSSATKPMWVSRARSAVLDDLAVEVVTRLEAGSTIVDRTLDGQESTRPVVPGDLAVLVRTNFEADDVRRSLEAVGVPVVIHGAGSVFSSTAARSWLDLLDALDRPSSSQRARAAVLTDFFGWSVTRLDTAADEEWEAVHTQLATWARLVADRGVAALFDTISVETGFARSLLAQPHGERVVTDLRHVTELLHERMQATGSTAAITGWLRGEIRRAATDAVDEQVRRLETDADAVQVLTVHRAKGLEYPIVYLPFGWRRRDPESGPPIFHEPSTGDRFVDIGADGSDRPDRAVWQQRVALHQAEADAEDLRLAYVAMTRPRHQLVLWWATAAQTTRSSLGRLVFGRTADGAITAETGHLGSDDDVLAGWRSVADRSDGTMSIEPIEADPDAPLPTWSPHDDGQRALGRRSFDREIDRVWARTSYSALTADAYEQQHRTTTVEHDERGVDDETLGEQAVLPEPAPPSELEVRLRGQASSFGEMTGGARFGTLLHTVLETVDFTDTDLPGAVRRVLADQHAARFVDLDEDRLVDALVAAIDTPLGPLAEGLALRSIERTDRLDELSFELPLAGGDRPRRGTTLAAIADLFEATVGTDDPLAGYHERLADPVLAAELRGFLTGSIDLVLRVPDQGRFLVVDHKSNWLGVPGEELSAWHYRPEALATAMAHAHYPLQAMLYSVALHRYLRWRVGGYDPSTHLGGVLYLFLRGMHGADVEVVDGQPCGVFAWRPPAALVTGLSDLLDATDGTSVAAGSAARAVDA